jgi:hypothetical protein
MAVAANSVAEMIEFIYGSGLDAIGTPGRRRSGAVAAIKMAGSTPVSYWRKTGRTHW